MSNLDSIIQVVITSDGRGVSRKSFGVPLAIGRHDNYTEEVREYTLSTATTDMVTDGFTTNDPLYRAVRSLAASTPKPEKVLVGRLLNSFTQIFTLEVKTGVVETGKVFAFNLVSPAGVVTAISYTAIALDTETIVAAAIAALINAVAGITVPVPGAAILTATADNVDEMWLITGLNILNWDYADVTVDTSLATELAGLTAINSTWYGLILADPSSNVRNTALAASIETQERIFGAVTRDTAVGDGASTTDFMFLANAAQYFRTYGIYSGDQASHAAAAWMGNRFPADPGSSTWSYKVLSGTIVDSLSAGFVTAVKAKKGNYYIEIADAPVTREGRMSSGEWIDVIRGRDWLKVRLQERLFGLLINTPKIPYTNAGIAQVEAQVKAQMTEGIAQTYLSDDEDEKPIVTVPLASAVSPANKIARVLTSVTFEATLAGAVHEMRIAGIVKN